MDCNMRELHFDCAKLALVSVTVTGCSRCKAASGMNLPRHPCQLSATIYSSLKRMLLLLISPHVDREFRSLGPQALRYHLSLFRFQLQLLFFNFWRCGRRVAELCVMWLDAHCYLCLPQQNPHGQPSSC